MKNPFSVGSFLATGQIFVLGTIGILVAVGAPACVDEVTAEECEAALDSALARCDSSSRQCSYTVLKNRCSGEHPDVVKAVSDCLTEESRCQTPHDPSGTDACVWSALEPVLDSTGDAIKQRVEALCTTTWETLGYTTYGALGPDPAAFRTCADAAADCAGLDACLAPQTDGITGC